MLKKILIVLFICMMNINFAGAVEPTRTVKDPTIMNSIVPNSGILTESSPGVLSNEEGFSEVNMITSWVKDGIFQLLMIITIGVFVFIGARLAVAKGDPEEFKKALTHFVYAIIGLFIVSVAWAAVNLVAGLNVSF